jgi:hypothetical protein
MQLMPSMLRHLPTLITVFALPAIFASCSDPLRSSATADTAQLLVASGSDATTASDRADIVSAQILGDRLELRVHFGGGCAEHDFSLVYSGAFRESHPVQTDLSLRHDAHDDPCRALLSRDLTFDLSPLRRAYQAAYGPHGVIIVYLRAPGPDPGRVHTLRYLF